METMDVVAAFGPKRPVIRLMQNWRGEEKVDGPVAVWHCPQNLSQSRIANRKRRSYACTIIAIRMLINLGTLRAPIPLLPIAIPPQEKASTPRRSKRKTQATANSEIGKILEKRPKLSGDAKKAELLLGAEEAEEVSKKQPPPPAQKKMEEDGNSSPSAPHRTTVKAKRRRGCKAAAAPPPPSKGSEKVTRGEAGKGKSLTKRLVRVLGLGGDETNGGTSGESTSSDETAGVPVFPDEFPPHLMEALLRSLLEGNALHDKAMQVQKRSPRNPNFDVPHAIKAVGDVVTELDWVVVPGGFRRELERQLEVAMHRWRSVMGCIKSSPAMSVLIISKERTVLFVYQAEPALVGLVDSHSHGNQGAILALCPADKLSTFCNWIYYTIFPDMVGEPEENQSFEVSLVMAYPPGLDPNSERVKQVKDHFKDKVFIKPPRRSARIAAKAETMMNANLNGQGLEAGKNPGAAFFDQPPLERNSSISSGSVSSWNSSWASSSAASSPGLNSSAAIIHRHSLGGGGGEAAQRRSPRHHRPAIVHPCYYYAPRNYHPDSYSGTASNPNNYAFPPGASANNFASSQHSYNHGSPSPHPNYGYRYSLP